MSPGALDLLEKMLVFDPNKRITGTRKELKFSCGITLNNWLLFQVFCFVLFFFFFFFTFSPNSVIILLNLSAVEEALCHPYLSSLHDMNDEPVCPTPFGFDFEQPSCTEEHIKELIWRESVKFNPDPTH
jgi:hypothetical protein